MMSVLVLCACKAGGIQSGSLVKMEYTLTVDGKAVDSSAAAGPYEFRAGAGQIVTGLEEGLLGLRSGQEKTLTVPPLKGYGVHDLAAVQKIALASFGALAKDLKIGSSVQGLSGGKPATGRVISVDSGTATLDFNHPLAGKTLVFKVKILSVRD